MWFIGWGRKALTLDIASFVFLLTQHICPLSRFLLNHGERGLEARNRKGPYIKSVTSYF